MKVVLPFWEMRLIDRYKPQINALADEISELLIIYKTGYPPIDMRENISFIQWIPPDLGHKYLNWWFGQREISKIVPDDIDIVYSLSGLWMNILGQAIADDLDIPHLIRMRGSMEDTRKYNGRGRVQNFLFSKAHEESFRSCTRVTSIVKKFNPWLEKKGLREDQIGAVIPNGIHLEPYDLKYPKTFTPGYAGRISTEKGSQFLLKLIKGTPQYTWRITGNIQDPNFVPPSNCHYLGITPFEKMNEFYNSISLLVQPSLTEGFPNILLEGFASGKPVIGSEDAYPDEVKVFGRRIKVKDNEAYWARTLGDFARLKPMEQRQLGFRAHEYARGYTWKAYGKALKAELEKAINLYPSQYAIDQE